MNNRTIRLALPALFCLLLGGCGVGTVQADLRDAVDAQQASLDECYRVTLTEDAAVAGDMRVRLTVDRSGSGVSDVEILGEMPDEALAGCVRTLLSGLQVSPPSKANVTVDYTLQFEQGAR